MFSNTQLDEDELNTILQRKLIWVLVITSCIANMAGFLSYGHVYGDEVLMELARLMKQEINGKGIAARYGGEEFMLLFEEADRERAMASMERIKAGLGEFSRETREVTITFSGGMEEYRTEESMNCSVMQIRSCIRRKITERIR